jgi:hypothetical protein
MTLKMVFGVQKLQDQIFCLTEERDFFQGKYLEQVSEIVNLKEQLLQSRKEIARLRSELMASRSNECAIVTNEESRSSKLVLDHENEEENENQSTTASCSGSSSLTHDTTDTYDAEKAINEGHRDDETNEEEDEDIRQCAEKLLQWASYRSSTYCSKPSHEQQQIINDLGDSKC